MTLVGDEGFVWWCNLGAALLQFDLSDESLGGGVGANDESEDEQSEVRLTEEETLSESSSAFLPDSFRSSAAVRLSGDQLLSSGLLREARVSLWAPK